MVKGVCAIYERLLELKYLPIFMKYLLPSKGCNRGCGKPLRCRTELFQSSLLPFTISEWNKLDPDVRNVHTYSLFRKNLLAFIKPIKNSLYNIYDLLCIKLPHRLRLGFSHLREHKFKHNFADPVNPLCSCSLEIESTKHFFLRYHNYVTFRATLMNELNSINSKFSTLEHDELVRTILYRDKILITTLISRY